MKKALASVLIGSMLVGANMYGTPVIAASENQISSNTFRNNMNKWGSISKLGGKLEFRQNAGMLLTNIYQCGDVMTSNQIFCEGFELYKNGKYCLEFDISSTKERMIEYRLQKGTEDEFGYMKSCIDVDQDITRVVKTFTMKQEHDYMPRLVFNFGNFGEELSTHEIRISNIRLYLVDDSKIEID